MWNVTFWERNVQKETEAGLGSDMSVSCFKEGKSYSISGTDFETPSLSKKYYFN